MIEPVPDDHHHDPDARAAAERARRQHREGWAFLISIFVAGAALIALASFL